MAYKKQTWVDDETVGTADRFNHMEAGIEEAGKTGGVSTGAVIGWTGEEIPEGYEEVDSSLIPSGVEVGTIVGWNGEGIPEGYNKFEQANVIQANLSTTTTFTTNDSQYALIPLDNMINQSGNKFTLENGVIKIGKGVSKIKVTGSVAVDGTTVKEYSLFGVTIYKNNYSMDYQRLFIVDRDVTYQYGLADAIIDVQENDIIGLAFRSVAATNKTTNILQGRCQTYIMVEEIPQNYIQKASVTPIEPKTGHIYDTTNIDNKAENTYSANTIDGLLGGTNWKNATINTQYFSNGIVRYAQIGKLVIVDIIDLVIGASISGNELPLITGLPPSKSFSPFMIVGTNESVNDLFRMVIAQGDTVIRNWYNTKDINGGIMYYGQFTYFTY